VAPFTYVASFAFTSHSAVQTFMLVFNLMAVILLVASFVMQQINTSNVCTADSYLKFVYRLLPAFSLGHGLMQLSLLKQLPLLESGCGTIPYAQRVTKTFGAFDMPVTGWSLTYMAVGAVAYLALAYAIELVLSYPALRAKLLPDRDRPDPGMRTATNSDGLPVPGRPGSLAGGDHEDEDVAAEAGRVDAGRAEGEVVVFRHLRKVYGGSKVAVRDLTLGIPRGETFGLLGINGA
jgi:ABC-type multidrug transport system fused ATPase/permease subunit